MDFLGNAPSPLGLYQRALDYYYQALNIAIDIGAQLSKCKALAGFGDAFYFMAQYREAIDYHLKALKIAREIGARQSECKDL